MSDSEQAPEPGTSRVIREARPDDVPAMLGFDAYAQSHASRGQALREAVGRLRGCWPRPDSAPAGWSRTWTRMIPN
ncbi:hypothetical protein BK642_17995 [Pseudomonas protegens]|nr:hypothetical protein BK639_17465 [Pseudomonas protegens]ROM03560.1 hypothetical protein BK641_15660 [Pseudomonas protegens]ROM06356.1 hypothetical protein BK642_17995 [Pseudomonas protegens]